MRFITLASSSHGNVYIAEDKDSRILLECGVSYKKLRELLGFSLTGVTACLLSHEHMDHAKAAEKLLSDGMSVYMSEGTAESLGLSCAEIIEDREQFTVGSFDVIPFATFHDAAEPLGFLLKSRADGEILVFATDTVNLRYKFPGVSIFAVEANYDRAVLERSEKLPEKVKRRIENAHMEIDTLCDYLSSLDLSECREIHLLHLSDRMSREAEFIKKVKGSVRGGIDVVAAPREVR